MLFNHIHWSFPGGLEVKNLPSNAGDSGSIPGSGRSPAEGNGYPLQSSCLENPTDRGACQATVHGVTNSQTWLSDKHILLRLYAAKGFPLSHAFYIILWSHTLTFTETQRVAEGNGGRKEKKIRKEILNYWEERANQIWREDTRQMSRDQSLEPTACAVPRPTV